MSVVDVRIRSDPSSFIGYQITFEGKHHFAPKSVTLMVLDKKELSEDEKKTQEYDKLAFRLVSYFAFPALIGYTIYSCKPTRLHTELD